MIHRAPFGSMERFTGLLIEHFAGKFPTWLAPEQVRVLPISDKVADFAEKVRATLAAKSVRVKLDDAPDKIGAKIRNARLDRVPYMIVVGQREAEEGKVNVRHRELDVVGTMELDEFVTSLTDEINQRLIKPAFTPQQKETTEQ
jgi:threonyl-tRNA synthetase